MITYVSSSSGQLCAHAGDGTKELFLRFQVNFISPTGYVAVLPL